MQGFIDFITSNNQVAEDLREHVVFKIVPIVNPDGVYLGNSKGNLLGQDLNRHWHDANPLKHPAIHAIKKLLEALDKGNYKFIMNYNELMNININCCNILSVILNIL